VSQIVVREGRDARDGGLAGTSKSSRAHPPTSRCRSRLLDHRSVNGLFNA